VDIVLYGYSLQILILHFIMSSSSMQYTFLDSPGKIMVLFMYFDYTKTVDPDTIITISLLFGCIFYVFLTDTFVLSRYDSACSYIILLFALFVGLRRAYSSYIIGLIFLA
jgi:hypothetical protein